MINTNLVLKHRKKCMGLAIILIMLCHTRYPAYSVLKYFASISQVGVDIFFFLSGCGLYSSLYHNSSINSFYKRRFLRIIPTYSFVFLFYSLFCLITSYTTLKDLIYSFSLISFFTSGCLFEWYIASLLVLYIVFPLIYKQSKKDQTILISIFITILLSFLISLLKAIPRNIKIVNEIFFVRLPVFLLGVLFGKKQIQEKKIICFKKIAAIVIFFVSIVLCVINMKFNHLNAWWINRFLFLPLSCSILVLASVCMNKSNLILTNKIMDYLGTITLEIYLVHEKVQSIIFHFVQSNGIVSYFLLTISVVSITIISSIIISNLVSRFISGKTETIEKNTVRI